ncbi:hypothetical protein [Gryllotalpicola kribbensis]|uniref:class I mannose-6-phosphate isomerase n=1 Tax=Gryllotalpicola kribbensis TaxID=993084 RepID=UPI0031D66AD5
MAKGLCTGRHPIELSANLPAARPYRGGSGIGAFRRLPIPDEYRPEDFLASTTEVFSGGGVGLTVLPDGRTLREAIADDAESWLGPDHVAQWGADPQLLVKLLHTGERLFVHYHPDAEFARARLGRSRGKTEAWVVLDAPDDGYALLGFARDMTLEQLTGWVAEQRLDELTGALNRVPLRRGDTLLVPAGIPHAIGPGITLVELQEPVDVSILLEYRSFGLDEHTAWLGLDLAAALSGLELGGYDATALDRLKGRPSQGSAFPASADPLFHAELVESDGEGATVHGYAVVIVTAGQGELGPLAVRRGSCVLVPFGAGELALTGRLRALICRPGCSPASAAAASAPATG